jgi:hypothetical protein
MSRRLLIVVLGALALPALALAAATDPQKQINPVDQRKAASIALKRTDFKAGWTKVPNTPNSVEDPSCPGYNPDQSDLILTGETQASFAGEASRVTSTSNVYKTKRDALAAWTRSVKPALVPCLARILKQATEGTGAKATIVKQGPIAFPKLAPRTAAYRVVVNVSYTAGGNTTTVPLALHLIALGSGRGDVILLTYALADGVPSSDLRAYAKLLAGRLAAAKL